MIACMQCVGLALLTGILAGLVFSTWIKKWALLTFLAGSVGYLALASATLYPGEIIIGLLIFSIIAAIGFMATVTFSWMRAI